jgi:putative membrane protein
MQIFIILSLIVAIIGVIFALQNLSMITVNFFFWSFHGSLALVLLATLLGGVVISLLASLPGLVRNRWSFSSQKKKLVALESEHTQLKQRTETAEKEAKTLEEQIANLSAEYEKAQNELVKQAKLADQSIQPEPLPSDLEHTTPPAS